MRKPHSAGSAPGVGAIRASASAEEIAGLVQAKLISAAELAGLASPDHDLHLFFGHLPNLLLRFGRVQVLRHDIRPSLPPVVTAAWTIPSCLGTLSDFPHKGAASVFRRFHIRVGAIRVARAQRAPRLTT